RQGAVADALAALDRAALGPAERHWVALLERALGMLPLDDGQAVLGGQVEGGARLINSDRLDVVRPLADSLNLYWYTGIFDAWADAGPVVAAFGLTQDTYYDEDPDGLDTALRLITRSEDTYVGAHTRLAAVYLGRFGNRWGVAGQDAVLVSPNPRSQDQLFVRLGGDRFGLRGFLSELDSITETGEFTGRTGDTFRGDAGRRRFLAAHRWDWRPSPRFALTFMESAVYSGPNAGFSLKYLNPMHPLIFVVDNTPKNDENNGFVGAMLWAQHRRLTFHGQLVVDDLDARGESGDETISFALATGLTYAAPRFDLGATVTAVGSRTYNAPQPEGKYLFALRGLGTEFSDFVHAAAFADLYLDALAPGLRLTPRLDLLAQGERSGIDAPFPSTEESIDNILDGVVERTVRPALQLEYRPVPWGWIRLDGGVNFTNNVAHENEASRTRFVGLAAFGLQLTINRAVRLAL
ncbi:MAG: hypothetical protein R3247_04705, partial [Rhodothermales bacterium]|nr:hypothetical protein [Rhodothermales bacterium]